MMFIPHQLDEILYQKHNPYPRKLSTFLYTLKTKTNHHIIIPYILKINYCIN